MFNRNEIIEFFGKIAENLNKDVTIYLIGGGALSLRELKDATKDVDIIVEDKEQFEQLEKALEILEFKPATDLNAEIYLTATAVFENKDSRIDIFIKEVCKQLQLSKSMKERAQEYKKIGNLTVKLLANEDIFLFKSIAGREADIIDCYSIITQNPDWKIILDECVKQHKKHVKWVFWLYEQIARIENTYDVNIPIRAKVVELCKQDLEFKPEDFMIDIKDKEKQEF